MSMNHPFRYGFTVSFVVKSFCVKRARGSEGERERASLLSICVHGVSHYCICSCIEEERERERYLTICVHESTI